MRADKQIKPLPFYKWFWQEYRANRRVQRMSYVARGLYRELLDECWVEGSIPDDVESLADICGCPVEVMKTEWPQLKDCFISIPDGRLINGKLHSVRTEEDTARVAMSEGGRKGGLKSNSSSRSQATLKPALTQDKPPSSQPDIEEKRREENKNPSPDGVLVGSSQARAETNKSSLVSEDHLIAVYKRYPRREDRADALRAISKAIGIVAARERLSSEEARQWLIARVDKYSQVVTAEQREKRHIKLPATWFNKASFDNEDLQPAPPTKTIEELCDLNGFDDPRNQWHPVTQEATSAN